jgi:hypothetical protein
VERVPRKFLVRKEEGRGGGYEKVRHVKRGILRGGEDDDEEANPHHPSATLPPFALTLTHDLPHPPPPYPKVVSVSGGSRHGVLVTENGLAWSFGAPGPWLGLGPSCKYKHPNPTKVLFPTPVLVNGASCGRQHTALTTTGGKIMTVGKAEVGRLGLNVNMVPRSSDPECAVPQVARLPGGEEGGKLRSEMKPVFSVTGSVWREAREAIGKFKEAKEKRIRDEDDTGEKRGDRGGGRGGGDGLRFFYELSIIYKQHRYTTPSKNSNLLPVTKNGRAFPPPPLKPALPQNPTRRDRLGRYYLLQGHYILSWLLMTLTFTEEI